MTGLRIAFGVPALALVLVTGCAPGPAPTQADGTMEAVPEAVLAAAAPWQDLTAITLREEDGCYWYRHVGPVETTFLPLLTREGRPICTRLPDAPAT